MQPPKLAIPAIRTAFSGPLFRTMLRNVKKEDEVIELAFKALSTHQRRIKFDTLSVRADVPANEKRGEVTAIVTFQIQETGESITFEAIYNRRSKKYEIEHRKVPVDL
jgi:hypothetical protein